MPILLKPKQGISIARNLQHPLQPLFLKLRTAEVETQLLLGYSNKPSPQSINRKVTDPEDSEGLVSVLVLVNQDIVLPRLLLSSKNWQILGTLSAQCSYLGTEEFQFL